MTGEALQNAAPLGSELVVGHRSPRSRGLGRHRLLIGHGDGWTVTQSESLEQDLQATAHGGVRDSQLALHLLQVSARAQEALKEGELLALEPPKASHPEFALEGRAAGTAMQARDGQLALADRTGGDDVVGHQRPPATRGWRPEGM